MAKHTEPAVNLALGEALSVRHPMWRKNIGAEQSDVLDNIQRRPDILLRDLFPIIVETEFEPAHSVEADACARLGSIVKRSNQKIEQVIACRLPNWLNTTEEKLSLAVENAEYEYCVFWGDKTEPTRWPKRGWIQGTLNDLADCLEMVSLSEQLIDDCTEHLERAIQASTDIVQKLAPPNSRIYPKLGTLLHQAPSEQSLRMAITILVNALVFHISIQQAHDLPDFNDLRNSGSVILPIELQKCWQHILDEINYWPIFQLALAILKCLGTQISMEVLCLLEKSVIQLVRIGATSLHDISGRILQRMITDRKFLATFYTLPNSATLLSELAVARMPLDWNDVSSYTSSRIADFACGTGTLITAGYQALLRRFYRHTKEDRAIHGEMMAKSLVAMDIMPAATHLTASQLSSTNPSETFSNTCVYTMPYGKSGRNPDRLISIGSLDLLLAESTSSLFGTGTLTVSGAMADQEIFQIEIGSKSMDLIIMNPPFTRPTNHKLTTVPVPSFAGFQTSADEQREMGAILKKSRSKLRQPVGDGKAGIASDFIDLAHVKIKPGGVLALVLPLTVLRGSSWDKFRALLAEHYEDICVISIAATGATARAFSADTGLAEVLIVATRRILASKARSDVLYVNLYERPRTNLSALEVAKAILRNEGEFNPSSGSILIGKDRVGIFIRAPISETGCAVTTAMDVAKSMLSISKSKLFVPQYDTPIELPFVPLADLGQIGPVHRLIGQYDSDIPKQRGVFRVTPHEGIPTYPILWNHDAERERFLIVQPDSQGEIREGQESNVKQIWKYASSLHLNLDFGLSSQPLAACITPVRVLGGRAWPSFVLSSQRHEIALALWCNSTIGLICRWWVGSRQHPGRSLLTVTNITRWRVLDIRTLSDKQLDQFVELFEDLKNQTLLPPNEAYRDEVRIQLDRAVFQDILGFSSKVLDFLALLRRQWCNEPSVHGGKSTRLKS